MNDGSQITAQLIMRRADGHSILDLGPMTAAAPNLQAGDLPPDRIAEIYQLLEKAGLSVVSGNANTLSVAGPPTLFRTLFGLEPDNARSASRIPDNLAPYIADITVPPPPEFFP
jgi:hypothetical protein